MNMYIVRHGETEWNRIGLVQGRADNPLNKNGIALAEKTSEIFREMHFEAVITSPLIRTKETARILCAQSMVDTKRIDERIIEKDFGICEGREIAFRYAQYPNGHAPGEESFKVVRRRMYQAIKEYANMYNNDILIVTHGCAIAALLKELDEKYERKFVKLNNVSITIINQNLEVLEVDMSYEDAKKYLLEN